MVPARTRMSAVLIVTATALSLAFNGSAPRAAARHVPTMAQFMSPAFPLELVAARRAERIAWIANDKGRRNVFTAAAPDFRPIRVTQFLDDDGVDVTQLSISDDGATVTFTRGHTANREGWVANPTADPRGIERAIWAARTASGVAGRIAEGSGGLLSPDGRWVAYARDGQIFRAATRSGPRTTNVDKGLMPFVKAWGANVNPVWSPDGRKLAFVSSRTDHSFIAVYDVAQRAVTYMSPSTDWDGSPAWSPDSARIAFVRRPGTPFAQQAHAGSGGLGNPPGPAYNPLNPPQRGASPFTGRGAQGRGAPPEGTPEQKSRPGLTTAVFTGGYTIGLWVADVATGHATEFWHNAPDDKVFTNINAITWAGDRVVFQIEPEEWTRFYSVAVPATGLPYGPKFNGATSLTPQDGQIETWSISNDGAYLYYGTNADDIERRHVWRVRVSGGTPERITAGDAIEHDPVVLASGHRVALLSADWNRPQSVAVLDLRSDAGRSAGRVIFPTLPKEFPADAHVVPTTVMTKAADGLDIHNQLFLPKDLRAGERRPAVVFVHGGPVRQMLLGYHYMEVYHLFYAVNQWLASQGYVVLSVNYRGGIGYGRSFRMAPNINLRGNAEYQDVVAGARYLQSRPDVDPKRVGIWGLSYGGLLTAQALARNSDIFVAGVDLAGVHLYGNSLDPENVAYKSSAISAIETWKSPVLLIHGDDDRNVNFAQTVGLVDLLRAYNVPYELMVLPDDVHETLLYRRWVPLFDKMEDFLQRNLWKQERITTQQR